MALEITAWCLSLFCFGVGIVGTVVPGMPGQVLISLGVLAHWAILRDASQLGWLSLIGVPLLLVAGQAVEWFSSAGGVKAKGGSKWAMVGAVLGSFLGLFVGSLTIPIPVVGSLIGMILFAGLGAFAAEVVIHRKAFGEARGVGMSASSGALIGLVVGVLFGTLIILVFVIDRFF